MVDNNPNVQGQFNQAYFQMARLNELFSRVDTLSANPLGFNRMFRDYNYRIIFRDLVSIFSTISAKLTPDEKKKMLAKKKEIDNAIIKNPPRKISYNYWGKTEGSFSIQAMDLVSDLFLEFKMELESLADRHGLGNPTKDDPRQAGARR